MPTADQAVVIDLNNGRRVIVLAADAADAQTPYFANTVWAVRLALANEHLTRDPDAAPQSR